MESIISIIAICVTLLLGVSGFIINSFVQRKSNSINVITKTRLARREKTKELMAKMIKLSSIEYLDSLDKEDKKATVKELVEVTADIRSEYSQIFEFIDLPGLNDTDDIQIFFKENSWLSIKIKTIMILYKFSLKDKPVNFGN